MSDQQIGLETLFRKVVDFFERRRWRYLLLGGLAVGVHGRPRVTDDADFSLWVTESEFLDLVRGMQQLGFCCDEDLAFQRLQQTGTVQFELGGRHIDVIIAESEVEDEMWQRRQSSTLLQRDVQVVPPEGLILYKLFARRELDIADIRSVLRVQGRSLDLSLLRRWVRDIEQQAGRSDMSERLEQLLQEELD